MQAGARRWASAWALVAAASWSCGKPAAPAVGFGGPCTRNADCESPYVCTDARCVVATSACQPGVKRCNGGTVEQCDQQGLAYVEYQQCAAGCAAGACLAPICQPGAVRCSGNALEACIPGGAEWAFVQFCASGCSAGTASQPASCSPPPQVCAPGATRCDGLALEQCTPDGEGWAFTKFCQNACTDGACQSAPQVCTPGQTQCDGLAVERCTPDGTAWAFQRFCPYQCDPSKGDCASPTCQPFSTRCQDQNTLQTCAADGSQWISQTCGSGTAGAQVCEDGLCRPVVCTPGATRCSEKTVETCDTLGTDWTATDTCAVGCQNGACETQQCTPGAKQCSGSELEACAPDGSGFVFVQYCATSCANGACTPPLCAPLSRQCDGNDVEVCDGAGGSWVAVQTCPDACSNGACVQKVSECTPGQLQCNGRVVQSCSADGLSFTDTEECLSQCANGACIGAACTGFSLSATPGSLPADGASTALVVSGPIEDEAGVPVPDGTMFTVAVTGGQFASADADPLQAGFQAKSLGGRIKFTIQAPAQPGPIAITASYMLSSVCVGTTTVAAVAPNGHQFFAEDFSSSVHEDPIATTATWDTNNEQVRAQPYDPTLGVNVGTGHDGDLVVPAGSTFDLETSKRPGLASPDVVIHTVTFIDTQYGSDFVFVDPPANGTLAPGDEVALINLQGGGCGSGNTCDPTIPNWSSDVGTYEFLTVREARPDGLVFFTTPVKNSYSDGGNGDLRGQKIFLQRVPNYDHVTIEGTLTTEAWDPDNRHTGMILFRAREGVTVAAGGVIDLDGKGYRGGNADKPGAQSVNTGTMGPVGFEQAGESYAGTPEYYRDAWGGGGGGIAATCWWGTGNHVAIGGSGGYGTSGLGIAQGTGNTWPDTGGGSAGGTYGDPGLSRLYLGSGSGANVTLGVTCYWSGSGGCCGQCNWGTQCGIDALSNPTCCWCGASTAACSLQPVAGTAQDGGSGGGILGIWANSLDVEGTIQADGVQPAPTLNGGSGGSILIYANSANLGSGLIHALGAYTNTYTVPTGQRPPGDGRIAVDYWDFALTGTTNPPATTSLRGVFRKDEAVSLDVAPGSLSGTITGVDVEPVLANMAGGEVTYSVSADGGRTWTDATPSQAAAIATSSQGPDLRWRVVFRPLSTAPLTLDGLVLDYQVQSQ